MADMFVGMQELPEPLEGVPNFRRVPSYQVYCCGQPTLDGFTAAIAKACGDKVPKDGKIIWINTRQEPCVYVNGSPICARAPDMICKNAEGGNVTTQSVARDSKDFLKACSRRAAENGGKLVYQDVFGESYEVEVKEIQTLEDIIGEVQKKFPGLVHICIPMAMNAAPKERDFDAFIDGLVGSGFNTPVIISDQFGDARATTGAAISCIFKEFQLVTEYVGLIESLPGMNLSILDMDKYDMDMTKNPMQRGEFIVINKLLEELKSAESAKKACDKIIDKNGTKETGGTGLVQLREEIAQNKMNYELVEDAEQAMLKHKIMDNIQKYFYLIVFTTYMNEEIDLARDKSDNTAYLLDSGKHCIPAEELKTTRTFSYFMEEHEDLRDMIEEGKGHLTWERDIPEKDWDYLNHMATDNFNENLGNIIREVFQIAHSLFADLPAGPHKKRATYRFASKTLLKLLPARQRAEVEMLISKKRMALDLYDILGHYTWQQKSE